ncbi:MAM and LDL-receptor class A domain-containing protein 1-like [Tachypleus tridentatus]|uniref:MAM and LDL-receptor class A domain-containing protein 1-like n=1 Tax=Tachypleus tridentatus TaxID=6853 RepID=UPI003FD5509D
MLRTCFGVLAVISTFHEVIFVNSALNNQKIVLHRNKRQEIDLEDEVPPPVDEDSQDSCDFGNGLSLNLCTWSNPSDTPPSLRWKTGRGVTSNWLGGPRTDHTRANGDGGYVFFETSKRETDYQLQSQNSEFRNTAILVTQNMSQTDPSGLCVSFFYVVNGLSVQSLKMWLIDGETYEKQPLWQSTDGLEGSWTKGEVAYTYENIHQIMFEGVPKNSSDPSRIFRGYIALDDIQFDPLSGSASNCLGHCTFEGGFCDWSNLRGQDDFDWELGRGSKSFLTGPAQDYSSFKTNRQPGGYAYIDSSFPRRPGDKARLISVVIGATGDNNPICMMFATHMFGNGVGTLRIMKQSQGTSEVSPIWEISGPSGNRWYEARVPVSSPKPFQLIFEATVGKNYLGDIAIDNITFRPGTCPIFPQTASLTSGDCNFEENTCSWSNPGVLDQLDSFDWSRQFSYSVSGPTVDHTTGTSSGYYMNLVSDGLLPQRGGNTAWLMSPQFTVSSSARCMAFYYFMFERTIDPSGPSLGSLRVYVLPSSSGKFSRLIPVWRLNNHQGRRWMMARAPIVILPEGIPPNEPYKVIIEGIWGADRVGYIAFDDISFFDGDCTTLPSKATTVIGECSFVRDTCGWTNGTKEEQSSPQVEGPAGSRVSTPIHNRQFQLDGGSLTWRLASTATRPANLQDHSFGAPAGYAFFDIFNQNVVQNPILRSPQFESALMDSRCISFWFAPFGRGESTVLSVVRVEPAEPETREVLWRFSTRGYDTSHPDWHYAQTKVKADSTYRIQFEGEATDGGFALDDITFYEGACDTRPARAEVTNIEV